VEVGSEALLVDKFDVCRFEIGAEAIHVRHEVSEDSLLRLRQLFEQAKRFRLSRRVQSNNGLLMILGRRSADIDKRLRRLKVNVIPLQLRSSLRRSPGQRPVQIKNLSEACDANQAAHFRRP